LEGQLSHSEGNTLKKNARLRLGLAIGIAVLTGLLAVVTGRFSAVQRTHPPSNSATLAWP